MNKIYVIVPPDGSNGNKRTTSTQSSSQSFIVENIRRTRLRRESVQPAWQICLSWNTWLCKFVLVNRCWKKLMSCKYGNAEFFHKCDRLKVIFWEPDRDGIYWAWNGLWKPFFHWRLHKTSGRCSPSPLDNILEALFSAGENLHGNRTNTLSTNIRLKKTRTTGFEEFQKKSW